MERSKKRYTIGYILSSMHFPWAEEQLSGAMSCAENRGINLCIIPGGRLSSPDPEEKQQNFIYRALNYEQLDGMIIWGSGLEDFINQDELESFVEPFKSKPVVMLEHPVSGCPLITMDCYTPVRDAVNHLIQEHHIRNIGFIRGPANHIAESDRFHAYLDAMEENGLTVQENWIVPPFIHGYEDEEEIARMGEWYRKFGTGLEGMSSFNDQRIFFLIDALARQGKRIPEDLLVCGHDDIRRSKYYKPGITTVQAPFGEMTGKAVDLIVDMIEGRQVPLRVETVGKLKIRESCGCVARDVTENQFRSSREELLLFEKRARNQLLINNIATSLTIFPDFEKNRVNFVRAFRNSLREISVKKCCVYLFQKALSEKDPPGRLKLYFDMKTDPDDSVFQKSLSPGDLIGALVAEFTGRESIAVLPVCNKQLQYGILVLGLETLDGSIIKSLQVFLGSFFSEFQLLEKISSQADSLLTANQKLQDSLEDLVKAKHQLVETEKIAAMGNLTSGIAHKINTPLGAALTTSTFLRGRLQTGSEDRYLLGEGGLSPEIFRDGLGLIEESLEKAVELVKEFKMISSAQSEGEVRTFLLKRFLGEISEQAASRWSGRVQVLYSCPDHMHVTCIPGLLSQIIHQLIENSVIHAPEEQQTCHISLFSEITDNGIHLVIEDDGPGIPAEVLDRIFDPFFTTRGGNDRAGLGLYMVYNLVTLRLNGKISAVNLPERGARFDILLPLSTLEGTSAE